MNPQGWQQPPLGRQPYPPKKNKAPLIFGIIAGVLVLGVAGTFGFLYLGANSDGGSPERGGTMPEVCANVPEAALAKGKDGSGLRNTDAYIVVGDAGREYERRVSQSKQNNQGTINERRLDGLGDEAAARGVAEALLAQA